MIIHIDMDAFFASIEQAINPRLKGKPLIVGSRNNRLHTVVCAASYEAKRLGIGSGMNSAEAFKICPQLEFVPAEQSKYIWTSEQIFEMLKSYGFMLHYASIDEFQMDIRDHPQPLKLASQVQEQIYANFNITASIGIAKNWLLAKLASKINKPNGIALINDANFKEVLSQASLTKLCGMAGKTGANLVSQGLKTCWDLYLKMPDFFDTFDSSQAKSLKGSLLSINPEQSRRVDENPGKFEEVENSKSKSIGHSYTLPKFSENPQFICAWIRLLSEMVGQRLRQQNLAANTIHLWLNGPEIGNFGAQKTFSVATNDSYEIYRRSLKIMAKMPQKRPKVRAIGVTSSQLSFQSYLPLLTEEKRREGLIKAVDRINNRFGDGSIYPAQVVLTRHIK